MKKIKSEIIPAVSVVAATYRRPALLRTLLEALGRQDVELSDFEVIIVDDESGDETLEVLSEFEELGRVNLRWVTQTNSGPAAARNRGVALAQGSLILFTDDDCVPAADWISQMRGYMDSHFELVGAGGGIVGRSGTLLSRFYDKVGGMKHGREGDEISSLITANASYRRSNFLKVDGFDERFPWAAGEDIDLSRKLRKSGQRLGECPAAMVQHAHRDTLAGVYRTYHLEGRGARLTEHLGLRPPASHWRVALGALKNNLLRSVRNADGFIEMVGFIGASFVKVVGLVAGRVAFDPGNIGGGTK